jgi:hypothetical protein
VQRPFKQGELLSVYTGTEISDAQHIALEKKGGPEGDYAIEFGRKNASYIVDGRAAWTGALIVEPRAMRRV